jgi:hypothetical protein
MKPIYILPRQARDKHIGNRHSTLENGVFRSAPVEGDVAWTVEAARVWRIDRSASGQETRFGYYAYTLMTIATCSTEDGQQPPPPPPPASAAEPEPEPAAAAAAAAAATTTQSGGMDGVSVVDVLAMDPTKRQELIQQLPALLAVCEIVDGFDPGAVREGRRRLFSSLAAVFVWLS